MKKRRALFFLSLILSFGCQKYYLSIDQQKIDQSSLASTYVGTPDPRQKNPPFGQELIIEWQIPEQILKKNPSIYLQIIYRDYSEASQVYKISHKTGYIVYSLMDEEYQKTKGLLSYKAEILTEDGEVFRSWQHQLWVNIIRLEDSAEIEEPEEVIEPASEEEDEEEESATFFPPTS